MRVVVEEVTRRVNALFDATRRDGSRESRSRRAIAQIAIAGGAFVPAMVPAATRFARTKTTIVLAAAGGVVLASALLGARHTATTAAPPDPVVVDSGGISI